MSDDLIKLLLQAGVDVLLAITLIVALYFLTKGKSAATASEAAVEQQKEVNDGKLIDAVTSNAAANSKNADTSAALRESFEKLVDVQTATAEWHKNHDNAIIVLSKNIKERSELDGEAFKELQDGLDTRLKVIETAVSTINNIVQTLPNRELFSQELSAIERRLTSAVRLNSATKHSTGTMAVIKVESIPDDTSQLGSATS
jgi:hypothetical protein